MALKRSSVQVRYPPLIARPQFILQRAFFLHKRLFPNDLQRF